MILLLNVANCIHISNTCYLIKGLRSESDHLQEVFVTMNNIHFVLLCWIIMLYITQDMYHDIRRISIPYTNVIYQCSICSYTNSIYQCMSNQYLTPIWSSNYCLVHRSWSILCNCHITTVNLRYATSDCTMYTYSVDDGRYSSFSKVIEDRNSLTFKFSNCT